MRQCIGCGKLKPLTEFSKHASSVDGIRTACKDCSNAQTKDWRGRNRDHHISKSKQWRADNPERSAYLYRRHNLLKYGLTVEQYDQMFNDQMGLCAVCLEKPRGKRRLHIDHDHACCPVQAQSCGKCVRGLVCHHCNIMLANAGDSVERLADAIAYLLEWEASQADGNSNS